MDQSRFSYLFERHIEGSISPAKRVEFLDMVAVSEHDEGLRQLMLDAWKDLQPVHELDQEEADQMLKHILGSQRRPISIMSRFRWVAAAVFISVMAVAGWLVLSDHKEHPQEINIAKADVKAPEKNRAMIILASGQKIFLDSVANGQLALLGNVQLVKLADGQIAYSGSNRGNSDKVAYNTIRNPRGSKVIDLGFVDGSHVWLNAGSSITYPVPFNGNERKVTINGEAYFEIAHNPAKPFKVAKGNMEVTVLGTHFNVNAYDDEKEIKVTLLEGSVKVTGGQSTSMLKPGQQALVVDQITVLNHVDLKQVMAWRTGQFSFDNTSIQTLMRQVARWYDVEVVYEKKMPEDGFNGITQRNENLSEVLKVLELNGGVHFRIDGTRVYVSP